MPGLRDVHGEWQHDAKSKANLFATTFAAKCQLPPPSVDGYTEHAPTELTSSLTLVRAQWTYQVLKNLRADTATGPDLLPARILKTCAKALAVPMTLLIRLLRRCGRWPALWKFHWIHPLYKKKAVRDPDNYRGLHLTPILSKVAERVLNCILAPFFEKSDAFGSTQWAFRKLRSCPDLLAMLINSWILAWLDKQKVGL